MAYPLSPLEERPVDPYTPRQEPPYDPATGVYTIDNSSPLTPPTVAPPVQAAPPLVPRSYSAPSAPPPSPLTAPAPASQAPAAPMSNWDILARGGVPDSWLTAAAQPAKTPEKGFLGKLGQAWSGGVDNTLTNLKATGNVYLGDYAGVEANAKAMQDQALNRPKEQQAFSETVAAQPDNPGFFGFFENTKNYLGAAAENPEGFLQEFTAQLPNSLAVMGAAGTGAAIGSVIPGVGTAIGATVGAIAGMFMGNVGIETGARLMEPAADGLTEAEANQGTNEGLIKGGVVTGIDTLTLGASKLIFKAPARAAAEGITRALVRSGVDVADDAAVTTAMKTLGVGSEALLEGARAFAKSAGRAPLRTVASAGLETFAEGAGEYAGEYAATGQASLKDAMIESIMSAPMSAGEILWAKHDKSPTGKLGAALSRATGTDMRDPEAVDRYINTNIPHFAALSLDQDRLGIVTKDVAMQALGDATAPMEQRIQAIAGIAADIAVRQKLPEVSKAWRIQAQQAMEKGETIEVPGYTKPIPAYQQQQQADRKREKTPVWQRDKASYPLTPEEERDSLIRATMSQEEAGPWGQGPDLPAQVRTQLDQVNQRPGRIDNQMETPLGPVNRDRLGQELPLPTTGRAPLEQVVTPTTAPEAQGSPLTGSQVEPPPVAIDDALLTLAQQDLAKSPFRFDLETDAQGVMPGKLRDLDRRVVQGETTLDEIASGWQATRDELRRRHGDKVTLYRADAPEEERNSDTKTVYMADQEQAIKFAQNGRKTEPFQVPVDDIVAVYARPSGYREFIVKRQEQQADTKSPATAFPLTAPAEEPTAQGSPLTPPPAPPERPAFTPTHSLSDGTPVRATAQPGIYEDQDGAEIEDNYADPLPASPLTATTTPERTAPRPDQEAARVALANASGVMDLNDRATAPELADRIRQTYAQDDPRNRALADSVEALGDGFVVERQQGITRLLDTQQDTAQVVAADEQLGKGPVNRRQAKAPAEPAAAPYHEQVTRAWKEAQAKPTDGAWDSSTVENTGNYAIRPLAKKLDKGGWSTLDELSPKSRSNEDPRRAVSTHLEELKQLGMAQTAWDNQGNPYHAKAGEAPPAWLTTQPDEQVMAALPPKPANAMQARLEENRAKRAAQATPPLVSPPEEVPTASPIEATPPGAPGGTLPLTTAPAAAPAAPDTPQAELTTSSPFAQPEPTAIAADQPTTAEAASPAPTSAAAMWHDMQLRSDWMQRYADLTPEKQAQADAEFQEAIKNRPSQDTAPGKGGVTRPVIGPSSLPALRDRLAKLQEQWKGTHSQAAWDEAQTVEASNPTQGPAIDALANKILTSNPPKDADSFIFKAQTMAGQQGLQPSANLTHSLTKRWSAYVEDRISKSESPSEQLPWLEESNRLSGADKWLDGTSNLMGKEKVLKDEILGVLGDMQEAQSRPAAPNAIQQQLAENKARQAAETAPPLAPPVTSPEARTPDEAPQNAVDKLPVIEVPLERLQLSQDVPQFKQGANDSGVVEPLGGKFDRTGVAPIQVWERLDGRQEVISGRHRLDLARRSGETSLPAQVHREADGFDKQQAAALDASLNIRDGQGKVIDYVDFFKAHDYTPEQASAEGLVARNPGKRSHAIAAKGGDTLIAQIRAGGIADTHAEEIANAAPGDDALQAVALDQINKGRSPAQAIATLHAVKSLAAPAQNGQQVDLFGFDDSQMQAAERMGAIAARKQREITADLQAINGVNKNPALAAKYDVNVKDPDSLKAAHARLKTERDAWNTWPTNPDLVAQVRAEAGVTDAPPALTLQPESEADLRAKDAAAQAQQQNAAQADAAAAAKEQADLEVDGFNLNSVNINPNQDDLFASPLPAATAPTAPTATQPPTAPPVAPRVVTQAQNQLTTATAKVENLTAKIDKLGPTATNRAGLESQLAAAQGEVQAAQAKVASHTRAPAGGGYGANGEWYPAGAFINTVPDNAKGTAKTRAATGKQQVAPGVYEAPTVAGQQSLFARNGATWQKQADGTMAARRDLNPAEYPPEVITAAQQDADRYNAGERWGEQRGQQTTEGAASAEAATVKESLTVAEGAPTAPPATTAAVAPAAEAPATAPAPTVADLQYVNIGTGRNVPADNKGRIQVRYASTDGVITVGEIVDLRKAQDDNSASPWQTSDGKRHINLATAKKHELQTKILPTLRDNGYVAGETAPTAQAAVSTPAPAATPAKPEAKPAPETATMDRDKAEATAKTPPAVKPAATVTPPAGIKDLAAHLSALADQEDIVADDWASRKYKGNNQRIELAGDGPLKTPETTVGAANESRRRKAIDLHRSNAAALRRAAKMPTGELVTRVREVLDKPIGITHNLSETKEYDLVLAATVLGMHDGQVGPGSPGRLLREAVEPVIKAQRQAEATAAQEERDRQARRAAMTPEELAAEEKESDDYFRELFGSELFPETADISAVKPEAKQPQETPTPKPEAKPAKAPSKGGFNPATFIKIAADDVARLRASDVDRLFAEVPSNPEAWDALSRYLLNNRPDLAEVVREAQEDNKPAPKPAKDNVEKLLKESQQNIADRAAFVKEHDGQPFTAPIANRPQGLVSVTPGTKGYAYQVTYWPEGMAKEPTGDMQAQSYAEAIELVWQYRGQLEQAQFEEAQAKPAATAQQAEAVTPAETKPAPTKSATPTAPADKAAVTNFGEQLPPSRRGGARQLSDELTDEQLANEPLSKIWPLKEVEAITDTFAAAVAHAARAEIPSKPRTARKLNRWVSDVKRLRELASLVVDGKFNRQQFLDHVAKLPTLRDWQSKVLLLEQLDRAQWGRIGVVRELPNASTMRDGRLVPDPVVIVQIDGRSQWFNGTGQVSQHLDAINAMLGVTAPTKAMQFEIRIPNDKALSPYIIKLGDGEKRKLMTFATVEEARDALKNRQAELVQAWENVKARDNITEADLRTQENLPRTGQDWRQGKDVTTEEFQATFGFKGGEWGKWVSQGAGRKQRQDFLNQAYDALMDLATIINVPPRALSLNGSLGIAFGARGSGSASAHFESSNLVINLTKTRGAGSLAHELFHALDNYFSRQRGVPTYTGDDKSYRDNSFITHKPEPMMVRKDGKGSPVSRERLAEWRKGSGGATGYLAEDAWIVDPQHPEGVRPEVEARMVALVKALNDSPMLQRAMRLDGRKSTSDGYWSRTLERAARAFENYVILRMQEQGYRNDFLANVIPVTNLGKNEQRYPYLLPEEMAPITQAFDDLFATLETREDEAGNVAMFSKSTQPATPGASPTAVRAAVNRITRHWANAPEMVVFTGMDDPQVDARVRAEYAKQTRERLAKDPTAAPDQVDAFYFRGKVYINSASIANIADLERAVRHEMLGHAGLRALFGNALNGILDQVIAGQRAAVEAKAKDRGLKMDKLEEARTAAEEVLAELAETRPNLAVVRRAVALIRRLLREMGITLALSNNDLIAEYILPARDFIERGQRQGTGTLGAAVPAFMKQGLPATITVDGVERPTTNSDGKPIHPTADGVRNFWQAFGDSKTTDYRSRPVVMYHGTPAKFTTFKPGLDNGWSKPRKGFYFTDDQETADEFGDKMEVYVTMNNPLDLRESGPMDKNFWAVYGKLPEEEQQAIDSIDLSNQVYGAVVYGLTQTDAFIDAAQSLGFDGLIIPDQLGGGSSRSFDSFIAFQSTQVKSATGNVGAYGQRPITAAEANRLGMTAAEANAAQTEGDIRFRLSPRQSLGALASRAGVKGFAPPTGASVSGQAFGVQHDPTWVETLVYRLQDRFSSLRKVQQALGPLPEDQDPYLAETLFHGKNWAAHDDFEKAHIAPIEQVMADHKLSVAQVDEFLYARHAPEANTRLRQTNAKRFLRNLIDATADPVRQAQLERDMAAITAALKTDPAALRDEYLTLLDQAVTAAATPAEEKVAAKWAAFRAKPSGMTDAEAETITRANRNHRGLTEIGQRIDAMTQAHIDRLEAGGLLTPQEANAWRNTYRHYVTLAREGFEDAMPKQGRGKSIGGRESQIRAGSTRRAVDILANTIARSEAGITRVEKAKVGRALYELVQANPDEEGFWAVDKDEQKAVYDSSGNVTYYPDSLEGDNQIKVKINGLQHTVTFDETNPHAMRIAAAMKNLDQNPGTLVEMLGKVNRVLAFVNTSASPEFLISNLARDVQTMIYNLQSTEAQGLARQIVKDIPAAMKGIHEALRGGTANSEWAKWWQEFEKNGGPTGWADAYRSIEARAKRIEADVARLGGHQPRRYAHAALKMIEDYNAIVENATRLAAYRQAVERGLLSKPRAAAMAKDLTTNFNRKGASGQVVNALYLFANAGIQGSARIITALRDSPKVRSMAYTTMVAAALLAMANRGLGDDDEDGEPYYDKIPDHVKERNMIFMLPGTKGDYVKIPLPWGYNVLWAMGGGLGNAVDAALGKHKSFSATKELGSIASATLNAFNPLQSGTLLQTIAPTILDPVVQIGENKNWAGQPLAPEQNSFDPVGEPNFERYWQSSRPISRAVAKGLSYATGGDRVQGGVIDLSPEWVDLAIDTLTGSAGRFVVDAVGTPAKALGGEELEGRDIPFARRVFGTPSPNTAQQLYFVKSQDVQTTKKKLEAYRDSPQTVRELRTKHAAVLSLGNEQKRTETILRRLRKARNAARDSGNKEREKAVLAHMNAIYTRFNKAYNHKVFGD